MAEKEGGRKSYQKAYWADYKKKMRRYQPRIDLSEIQYQGFEKDAKAHGFSSVSKTIKHMALAYQQESFLVPLSEREKLDEFVFLVRNIANNLNQIAHHSNAVRGVTDESRVFEHLKKLENEVKSFVSSKYKKKKGHDH